MENKNEVVLVEEKTVCKFENTYNFEGKEISEVDLTGLADVTAADMIAVNRIMALNGASPVSQEFTMEYALQMAARVSKVPYEFYERLSMSDAFKGRRAVQSFF